MSNEYKMVLVYRRDLNMRKGKMAAQVGHAVQYLCLGCYLKLDALEELNGWVGYSGSKKVVLSCDDEESLLAIGKEAKRLQIPNYLVTDTGHTEFHGVPTNTVIGLGPFRSDIIDQITGPEGVVKCRLA